MRTVRYLSLLAQIYSYLLIHVVKLIMFNAKWSFFACVNRSCCFKVCLFMQRLHNVLGINVIVLSKSSTSLIKRLIYTILIKERTSLRLYVLNLPFSISSANLVTTKVCLWIKRQVLDYTLHLITMLKSKWWSNLLTLIPWS